MKKLLIILFVFILLFYSNIAYGKTTEKPVKKPAIIKGKKGDTGEKGDKGEKGDMGLIDTETLNRLHDADNSAKDGLNNQDKRISNLEDAQFNLFGELQFIREKNYTLGIYGKYDIEKQSCPEAGIKLTVGFGESWEAEQIKKLNEKLERLEALLK